MYWILAHTQLLIQIYINGAIIVGCLVALIHIITFSSSLTNVTTKDLIVYHISFVSSFLVWPAELIRFVGCVIYEIRVRLKNKKLRNQRRGFY